MKEDVKAIKYKCIHAAAIDNNLFMENDDAELSMLYSHAVHKTPVQSLRWWKSRRSANTHEALMWINDHV